MNNPDLYPGNLIVVRGLYACLVISLCKSPHGDDRPGAWLLNSRGLGWWPASSLDTLGFTVDFRAQQL